MYLRLCDLRRRAGYVVVRQYKRAKCCSCTTYLIKRILFTSGGNRACGRGGGGGRREEGRTKVSITKALFNIVQDAGKGTEEGYDLHKPHV